MKTSVLNNYFRNNWKPNWDKFKYSGWTLLDKIDKDAHILDIGCGYNDLKKHFPNLYGIDPCNSNADQEIAFEDYIPHKNFDVFLALGSLNFGDEKVVDKQIEHLYNITKKGDKIYWRQNPGLGDHPWKGVEEVKFFPWSYKYNEYFSKKYSFVIIEYKKDRGDRLYVEWIRT